MSSVVYLNWFSKAVFIEKMCFNKKEQFVIPYLDLSEHEWTVFLILGRLKIASLAKGSDSGDPRYHKLKVILP